MDKKSEAGGVKNEVIEVTDFKISSKPRKEKEPNQDFSFYLTIANQHTSFILTAQVHTTVNKPIVF